MHVAERVRNVAPGTRLMRQGQSADGVLILESGTADVMTALPGEIDELERALCTQHCGGSAASAASRAF